MSSKSAKMHVVQPVVKGHGHADENFGVSYIPEFTTVEEFVDKKIKMLREDFRIKLNLDDIAHLKSLETENQVNAAVKAIINKYWE